MLGRWRPPTNAVDPAVTTGENGLLSDRVLVMTPRPGRLAGILKVDLPRPRTTAVMREPRYSDLVFEIRRMIGVDH